MACFQASYLSRYRSFDRIKYNHPCWGRGYFTHSQEVYDRFPIKKTLHEAVDLVRRAEVKQCEALKNTKYLWLKGEQKLKAAEKSKLAGFIAEGTCQTAIACQMKTAFNQL